MIKSRTTATFRDAFANLPDAAKRDARRAYRIFRDNPHYQSLQFKKLKAHDEVYSVRIGLHYRALGVLESENTIAWFWIGTHAEYDRLV